MHSTLLEGEGFQFSPSLISLCPVTKVWSLQQRTQQVVTVVCVVLGDIAAPAQPT